MAMRADRKNYVMSVEFAMQREMEYRKNLQKQGLLNGPLSELPVKPASNQVPRTIPRPTPYTYLRPNQGLDIPGLVPPARPPIYPYPAEQSRPSLISGPSAEKRRKLPAPLPPGAFTCQVCQIDCTTGFNLLSHYQGQKHKARLRGSKGKEVAGGTMPLKPSDRRPYCDMCGIWCVDEHTYRLHFSCPNHILRQYDSLMKNKVYRNAL